ncbi:hypothetical protein CFC21_050816 [Triticum aestivum]|uniref:Uncharacterized protein n=2 Tax=Triticum aestivum TaxID=4565 RepID=A0A3B6HQ18_WHEAT|nr:transmembrane protein 131-like [Triticum aestivum]KAF7040958.1 hypothetical protein CFC21_050816 [Triticum aestivum]
MVTTTLKSRPPHALSAMTTRRRRRRRSSPAAPSIPLAPLRSASSPARASLAALCCVFLAFALSVSAAAAAADSAEESHEDGRCLGFRDVRADGGSFCFSSSEVQTLLASDDVINEPDLGVSRDWGPSRSMCFPMSGGGMVTCSSADAIVAGARDALGREGKDVARYDAGSCQAPLVPDNWMQASHGVPLELDGATSDVSPNALYSSSSMNVEISPPVLDWGRSNLYAASVASLTVVNLNNDSVLRVYEPFSTDPQFYVYGYEDLVLQPGENASVTFMFLPKLLGSSSAHLVLQTNFGGFIIQAKGMAVGSPYQILPLTRMDVVIGGHLEKNLSIYNPFDDSLYVEEVAVWMSASESTKQSSHVVCQLGPLDEAVELTSLSSNWHTASSTEFGWPVIHIRPSEQWEVLPSESSTVIELKLQPISEGKVFGAIYMKLRNHTTDKVDIVVIPIELEVHTRTYYDSTNLVSVTFERISSCAGNGSIYSLSLRNDATELLKVVSITGDNRDGPMIFQLKYLNGLILFPDTVTDIALIRYTASVPKGISFDNCNIVVETNSSLGSSIVIPCQDIMRAPISHTTNAVVADSDEPFAESHSEETSANSRTGSLGSIIETEGPHNMKPTIGGAIRADDMVLRNWRSHGTMTGISVLTNHELVFPVVQIGSQFSEWITVHNPSQQHVSMQLVLNSEEIIGQCRTVNDECEHTFSSRSPEIDSTETRFGFSLGSKAITETYLGPLTSAVLGPIVFRPSNRCMWSSMALIRNNLSGLEWLPLRAPGGWQSIALLEGPEAVWKLEFNLGSNLDDNSTLSKSEIPSSSCSQQLSKEIHVKNSGDLPLRVTKVKVSGVDCGLDGFTVNNCKGFSLAPSESIRMLISFKADFSSVKVQRDLELAMTTGIFVIPMTANIPVCMLKQCKRSYFRSIHWKALILFLGTVSLFVVVIVRGAPYSLSANSQDYYAKIADRKDTISKTVKPSFPQGSNKTSRPIREHRKAEEAPPEKCPPSTLDSPRKKDDKSNADKQQSTTSAISVSPTNPVEDKVSTEVTETSGNLTIRVAREKGRRRKRKVGGAGLAAKFEVSSSHSGNSTPSSPLSPSLTPKQGWSFSGASSEPKHRNKLESRLDVEARAPLTGNNKVKNGWSQTAKQQPPAPPATSVNPLASSTALTTAWRSPLLASSSPIAPHARAPGSNLMKDKAVKRDEGVTALKKEFTYDIWGDHFSGHLLGKAREVAPGKVFTASEGSSYSFFAREPQALMMKQPSAPPDSRGRRSLPSDVASGYAIN